MPLNVDFQAPWLLAAAAVAGVVVIILGRRAALPPLARGLAIACILLLVLGAGRPVVDRPRAPRVALMVDLSPSTRTAAWREPAALAGLAESLKPRARLELFAFAADAVPLALADYSGLDRPALATRLPIPLDADAVLALTDGRLSLQGHAHVTLAIDPALLNPPDAAVTRLAQEGLEVLVTARAPPGGAALRVGDAERAFASSVVIRHPAQVDRPLIAGVDGEDPWPENDAIRLPPVPLAAAERLWLGESAPPPGFYGLSALPGSATALAGASVVVIANTPASAIDPAAQRALRDYVMDLGGTLVILGGGQSFAAGGYAGTLLEELSPLASRPPAARARWVLLVDASGSMAAPAEGRTRFTLAIEALLRVPPALPQQTPITIGAFAENLAWWAVDVPADEAARLALPPPGARPAGPTNLAAALEQLAGDAAEAAVPTQVIVLTDARVPLEDMTGLSQRLRNAQVTLNVINVGPPAEAALVRLVETTGGRLVHAEAPGRWGEEARELAQSAAGEPMEAGRAVVRFTGPLAEIAPPVEEWNRTWLKQDSQPLVANEEGPLAAVWQVGLGRVAAFGFELPSATAGEVALALEGRPLGEAPVEWDDGPELVVSVQAEAESVSLRRAGRDFPAQRVGPQRWEARIPAPREPAIAAVVVDGQVVERIATAGRYAPEFELEPLTMDDLRGRFEPAGHRVIALDELAGWSPPRVYRRLEATPPAALLAALLGGAALAVWRRGGGG